MAFEYQNFASLGVNLNRQKYGPLDISAVFNTSADLQYYLSKGAITEGVSEYWYKDADNKVVPYPYEGQVIATAIDGVVSVFALALENGQFVTQEIGGKVTADEKSVTVSEEGVVSVFGFEAAADATLPQKQPVYKLDELGEVTDVIDHYEIKWVPISAIVEGDGNTTTEVKAADGSAITVTPSYDEANDKYTYTLDVTLPAIPEYTVTKSETEGGYNYTVTKDGTQVGETIFVPNAYDDTALAGRVSVIEGSYATKTELGELSSTVDLKANAADVYNKGEVDAKVAALEGTTHFIGVKEALPETANNGDICIVGNKEYVYDAASEAEVKWVEIGDTAAEIERITAVEGRLDTAEGKISTLETKVSDLEAIDFDAYVDADTALENKLNAEIAKKQDIIPEGTYDAFGAAAAVQTALDGVSSKVDGLDTTAVKSATIAHGTTDSATVENNNLAITIDAYKTSEVYTKSEVDTAITTKISDMTGGESAADVLNALKDYKTATDSEIYGAEKVAAWTTTVDGKNIYNPVYTETSRIDTLEGKVAAAESTLSEATKDITELETASTTNANDISLLGGRVGTLESDNATNKSNITAIDTKINTLNDTYTAHETAMFSRVGKVEGDLLTLTTNYQTADTNLQDQINTKAEKTAVTAIENKIGTVTEGKTVVEMIADAQTAASYDDTAIKALIKANEDAIKAEQDRAAAAEQTLTDAVELLTNGVDADKVDGVNDLIKYVEDHGADVTEIFNRLDGHDTVLAGIGGENEPATVLAAIEAASVKVATDSVIGGIKSADPMNDNVVTVAESGFASVARVNVATLVQTEGQELILNGGNA